MTEKTQKDGVDRHPRAPERRVRRDPLEPGSARPLREGRQGGARNSKTDQEHLDAIARHAIALGATSTGGDVRR
jgi:hypothetical protein